MKKSSIFLIFLVLLIVLYISSAQSTTNQDQKSKNSEESKKDEDDDTEEKKKKTVQTRKIKNWFDISEVFPKGRSTNERAIQNAQNIPQILDILKLVGDNPNVKIRVLRREDGNIARTEADITTGIEEDASWKAEEMTPDEVKALLASYLTKNPQDSTKKPSSVDQKPTIQQTKPDSLKEDATKKQIPKPDSLKEDATKKSSSVDQKPTIQQKKPDSLKEKAKFRAKVRESPKNPQPNAQQSNNHPSGTPEKKKDKSFDEIMEEDEKMLEEETKLLQELESEQAKFAEEEKNLHSFAVSSSKKALSSNTPVSSDPEFEAMRKKMEEETELMQQEINEMKGKIKQLQIAKYCTSKLPTIGQQQPKLTKEQELVKEKKLTAIFAQYPLTPEEFEFVKNCDINDGMKVYKNLTKSDPEETVSLYNLAFMYKTDEFGVFNFQKFKRCMILAAIRGNNLAQFEIAVLFSANLITLEDYQNAIQKQTKIIQEFNKTGKNNKFGKRTSLSLPPLQRTKLFSNEEALINYQASAAGGNIPSLLALGNKLFFGLSNTPKNCSAAQMYYRAAVKRWFDEMKEEENENKKAVLLNVLNSPNPNATYNSNPVTTAGSITSYMKQQMEIINPYLDLSGRTVFNDKTAFHFAKNLMAKPLYINSENSNIRIDDPLKSQTGSGEQGGAGDAANQENNENKISNDLSSFTELTAKENGIDEDRGQAKLLIGYSFLYGMNGVPEDTNLALKNFKEAVALNCYQAYGALGNMFFYGIGVKPNNETAFEYFTRGAAFNDEVSLNGLGKIYFYGAEKLVFLNPSPKEQEKDKLPEEFQMDETDKLTTNIKFVPFIPEDKKKAFGFFNMTSLMFKSSEGSFYIGIYHLDGFGVIPKNPLLAVHFFNLASYKKKNVFALYRLAMLYNKIYSNCEKSVDFLRRIAESAQFTNSDFELAAKYLATYPADYDRESEKQWKPEFDRQNQDFFETLKSKASKFIERNFRMKENKNQIEKIEENLKKVPKIDESVQEKPKTDEKLQEKLKTDEKLQEKLKIDEKLQEKLKTDEKLQEPPKTEEKLTEVATKNATIATTHKKPDQKKQKFDYIMIAILYYLKLSEMGVSEAQQNMGYLLKTLYSTKNPILQHYNITLDSLNPYNFYAIAAVSNTQQSHSLGSTFDASDSLVQLGNMFYEGKFVNQSFEKAADFYTRAANFYNSQEAMFNLGIMHQFGIGNLKQDFYMAKRWFDKSLQHVSALSSKLGIMPAADQSIYSSNDGWYPCFFAWCFLFVHWGVSIAMKWSVWVYSKVFIEQSPIFMGISFSLLSVVCFIFGRLLVAIFANQ